MFLLYINGHYECVHEDAICAIAIILSLSSLDVKQR